MSVGRGISIGFRVDASLSLSLSHCAPHFNPAINRNQSIRATPSESKSSVVPRPFLSLSSLPVRASSLFARALLQRRSPSPRALSPVKKSRYGGLSIVYGNRRIEIKFPIVEIRTRKREREEGKEGGGRHNIIFYYTMLLQYNRPMPVSLIARHENARRPVVSRRSVCRPTNGPSPSRLSLSS